MIVAEIWPSANTVQQVSKYFIDLGEAGRWNYYSILACSFYALVLLVVYSSSQSESSIPSGRFRLIKKVILSDVTFLGLVILIVLMARIPLAVLGIQNPDEPYWEAEAKTFLNDPRPFVGVSTGTSGPLVPIALLMLKVFGLPIDAGSLKIMSGVMMALSMSFLYLAGVQAVGSRLSRLVILPLVVSIALMNFNDMIAYNGEHPVILLHCLSLFFFARLMNSGSGTYSLNIVFLGFTLGLVPFTKLQGVPVALFIGIAACFVLLKKGRVRELLILIVCALLPVSLLLVAVGSYDGLQDFWMSYIKENLVYTSQVSFDDLGLIQRIERLTMILLAPPELHYFFYYSFSIIITGIVFLLVLSRKITRTDWERIFFSIMILAIAFYSILASGRPFPHYILLSLVPITILVAIILQIICRLSLQYFIKRTFWRVVLSGLFLVATAILSFQSLFTYKPEYLNRANITYEGFAPQGLISVVLDHYESPGVRVAVWDYEPEIFEGNNFLMGTRYAAFTTEMTDPYNLANYLKDLKTNKPELFVYPFGRAKSNFEDYAEIKKYINDHYTLEHEIAEFRVYVRNDFRSQVKPWTDHHLKPSNPTQDFHCDLIELSRNGSFLKFNGWTVLGNNTTNQHVKLALINIDSDKAILVNSYQVANKSLVDFSPHNKDNLMSSFLGLIPLKEIPSGYNQVGILVENKELSGFKLMKPFGESGSPIQIGPEWVKEKWMNEILVRWSVSGDSKSIWKSISDPFNKDQVDKAVVFDQNRKPVHTSSTPNIGTVQQVSKYFIDLGEAGRWKYYSILASCFYFLLFLSVYANSPRASSQYGRYGFINKILLSNITFAIFIVIVIILARMPLAIYGIQNPDEPSWVAVAKTLFHDPRPFVSIDTGNDGPVVPLTLLTLKIFGLPIDEGSLKLMTGGIMAICIIFLFMAGVETIGSGLSKLVILPLLVASSFMKSGDMIAYNSEYPAILFLCVAIFFLAKVCNSGHGFRLVHLASLGFILGIIPFARLQAIPITFFICLGVCFMVYKKDSNRNLLCLLLTALMPSILILLSLSVYGGLRDFWISYIQNNLFYASEAPGAESGFGQRMATLFDILFTPPELNFFFYYSFTIILVGAIFVPLVIKKLTRDDLKRIFFSIALLVVSVFCIVGPGVSFTHDILFSLVAVTILVAVMVHIISKIAALYFTDESLFPIAVVKAFFATIFLVATSFYYFQSMFTYKPDYLEAANRQYNGFTPQGAVGEALNRYATPQARIAVWGYEPELFEGNEFFLGTRYATFSVGLVANQENYLTNYLNDMKTNKPELFVYPSSRSDSNFEDYADIKMYINEYYRLTEEIDGYKIYMRK